MPFGAVPALPPIQLTDWVDMQNSPRGPRTTGTQPSGDSQSSASAAPSNKSPSTKSNKPSRPAYPTPSHQPAPGGKQPIPSSSGSRAPLPLPRTAFDSGSASGSPRNTSTSATGKSSASRPAPRNGDVVKEYEDAVSADKPSSQRNPVHTSPRVADKTRSGPGPGGVQSTRGSGAQGKGATAASRDKSPTLIKELPGVVDSRHSSDGRPEAVAPSPTELGNAPIDASHLSNEASRSQPPKALRANPRRQATRLGLGSTPRSGTPVKEREEPGLHVRATTPDVVPSSSSGALGAPSLHGRASASSAKDPRVPEGQGRREQQVPITAEERREMEVEKAKLTANHQTLLYLVALYSNKALSADEEEEFFRHTALLILLYEGTTRDVFNYDYAPASMYVGRRRIYLNIAQDGVDDLDDLREAGFINGLRLTTRDNRTIGAFQVSMRGLQMLQCIPQALKDKVNTLVFHTLTPPGGSESETPHSARSWTSKSKLNVPMDQPKLEFLQVNWSEEEGIFRLMGPSGYSYKSDVTECEDVSYVSSPYIPRCLRKEGRPTRDVSSRAAECAAGSDNIRDELSEAIHVDNIHVLIGEWIPFGANQIVELNDKLGSMDRVKGGFFTAVVDEDPASTTFSAQPGMTSVEILDCGLTTHLNFEAEIRYPEEGNVIQIENFGIHIPLDGTVLCGLRVEAIDRTIRDEISLDKLSRLLVDVHQDSSLILDSLISQHQRGLLDTTYSGDSQNRDKFSIVIGSAISPKLRADKYLDKEDLENELKQIVGQTHGAVDLNEEETLIYGRHGVLLTGPKAHRHEGLLLAYLSLLGREVFIKNLYNRISVLDDSLTEIRQLITHHEANPNSIERIRMMLSRASRDIILITECLAYMEESLQTFKLPAVCSAIKTAKSLAPPGAWRSVSKMKLPTPRKQDVDQDAKEMGLRVPPLALGSEDSNDPSSSPLAGQAEGATKSAGSIWARAAKAIAAGDGELAGGASSSAAPATGSSRSGSHSARGPVLSGSSSAATGGKPHPRAGAGRTLGAPSVIAKADETLNAFDAASVKLADALGISSTHTNLRRRVEDMRKNVSGCQHELDGLRELADVISESQMFRLQESMQANTKNLEEVFRSNERGSRSLEIMQVILSGTLAFELLDRLTGEWTVVDQPWAKAAIVDPLISVPGVWFIINIVLWCLVGGLLIWSMRYYSAKAMGVITFRVKINLPVNLDKLLHYLAAKSIEGEDGDNDSKSHVQKVGWTETGWGSHAKNVDLELMYDKKHAYLLSVYFQMQKYSGCMKELDLKRKLFSVLEEEGIIDVDREEAWVKLGKHYT